jgi:hypothetical protein
MYKAEIIVIILLSIIALGAVDTSYREGVLGAVVFGDYCYCPID